MLQGIDVASTASSSTTAPGEKAIAALDELDRRLIAVIDADPAGTYTAWAERLDVSDRTVTRRYRALRDTGVVRVRGRTLPGFDGRIAWLTRTLGSPAEIARLADVVARFAHSRWVRLSRDGTELTAGLVTDPRGEDEVLRGLTSRRAAERTRTHELLRVWGSPSAVDRAPRALDRVDLALLRHLGHDGRATLVELAAAAGVDATTVGRRRARLVEEGVLYFEADVDPRAQPDAADAMVWMTVAPGGIRALGGRLSALPEVRFVAATSGTTALVANVVTARGRLVDVVDEALSGQGVSSVEIVPQGRVLKRAPAGWA